MFQASNLGAVRKQLIHVFDLPKLAQVLKCTSYSLMAP